MNNVLDNAKSGLVASEETSAKFAKIFESAKKMLRHKLKKSRLLLNKYRRA